VEMVGGGHKKIAKSVVAALGRKKLGRWLMEQNNRILTRDLKLFLAAVVEVTKAPGTVERLLAAAERAEAATERYMAEQHELRCMKDEHRGFLSRAGKEHDEQLRMDRLAWEREEEQRRKRLGLEEDAIARKREAVRALQERLERKAVRAGIALAPDESAEQVLPAGCDSVIEQQPAA
jgi:hypothetical protein